MLSYLRLLQNNLLRHTGFDRRSDQLTRKGLRFWAGLDRPPGISDATGIVEIPMKYRLSHELPSRIRIA